MSQSKHFRTAKENQTAPTLNNASIYRAGQNPTKNQNDSDDEDEPDMIKNSFYVPDRLHSQQQPTFVDALKRRRDHTGRIITKSQVLQNPNRDRRPERLNLNHLQYIILTLNHQSLNNLHPHIHRHIHRQMLRRRITFSLTIYLIILALLNMTQTTI